MANEATIRSVLQIRKDHLNYQSQPSGFNGDVEGNKGPSPGAITVDTDGVAVNLSELTTPGYCRLMNLDEDNYVEWGIHVTGSNLFVPIGEIRPGESYVIRFSRNLLSQYEPGTGTGTTGDVNEFYIRANTANCVVLVEAFEA